MASDNNKSRWPSIDEPDARPFDDNDLVVNVIDNPDGGSTVEWHFTSDAVAEYFDDQFRRSGLDPETHLKILVGIGGPHWRRIDSL